VQGTVTVLAVVVLVVSAVSFAGSLQVVYERTLSVAHAAGWYSRTRAAAWLAVAGAYVGLFLELRPDLTADVADGARAAITIVATFLFWLWTPRILLGPRSGGWQGLVPIAGVTALAISLLTLASPLWMPGMISDEASRFGTIGVAFALARAPRPCHRRERGRREPDPCGSRAAVGRARRDQGRVSLIHRPRRTRCAPRPVQERSHARNVSDRRG
jgi:hypothetical protein